MAERAQLGKEAEARACNYLQQQGLRVVERNYRCRRGEIDLVMDDGESVVFVEVRYRSPSAYADGVASVDRHKQARLIAAAQHYLQQHPASARRPCRFDVVAVTPTGSGDRIEWISNAIELQ